MEKTRLMTEGTTYPAEAYAPDGLLWWELHDQKFVKGAKGSVPRMASWLRWNVNPGERFSTREMREVFKIKDEHFQRRQRELREYGWKYLSSKEDSSLGDECELVEYGWRPGEGPRPRRDSIFAKVRRQVFERDGRRCVICGLGADDLYDGGSHVVLTAGHVRANSHGGSADLENLQTECRRCNESARADTGTPIDAQAMLEAVRSLKASDRMILLGWLRAGRRTRNQLDRVHDEVRQSGPAVQAEVIKYLERLERRQGGREHK